MLYIINILVLFRTLAAKCKTTVEIKVPNNAAVDLKEARSKEYVVVLYDYSAQNVAVKKGDLLPLLNSTEHREWWKVELNGKPEYVPASYVRIIDNVNNNTNVNKFHYTIYNIYSIKYIQHNAIFVHLKNQHFI